jgi:hypothetical protein
VRHALIRENVGNISCHKSKQHENVWGPRKRSWPIKPAPTTLYTSHNCHAFHINYQYSIHCVCARKYLKRKSFAV